MDFKGNNKDNNDNNIKALKADVKKSKFTENIFVVLLDNSRRGSRYILESSLKNILQRKIIFVKTFEYQ